MIAVVVELLLFPKLGGTFGVVETLLFTTVFPKVPLKLDAFNNKT